MEQRGSPFVLTSQAWQGAVRLPEAEAKVCSSGLEHKASSPLLFPAFPPAPSVRQEPGAAGEERQARTASPGSPPRSGAGVHTSSPARCRP